MSISEKDVGRRIASLTPEQRRLLELRMQRQAKVDPSKPRPLPRAAGPNAFPLSFAQQRLWLLERLGMGGTAYSVFQAVRLTGPLDVEVLSRCFTEIARRQESLRTRFEEAGSGPVQIVDPPRLAPIHRVDLTVLPVEEREPEALRRASEEVRVPFDPGRDELMRRILYRTGEQRHMLLIVLHHIVSDGWSMGVLLGEITALYAAFSAGLPSPLPELPVQYADFSVWQREWLSGETLAEQIGYWRQRLHGAPALLELPADRPRPAIQTTRGALLSRLLPRELAQELGALSRREGLTLFMTLLAALEILLHRYTGATDLVVGTPIANRQRTEIEQLVGFFVNTLVLRTDLRQDPSFRELGRRVREVALGAFGHQDLPFEKLVDELRPERSRSHSPLFQGMFNLLNAPLPQVKLAGLTLVPIEIEDDASKFDFTLNVQEVESGLTVRWQYNRDLFDASTVERMDGHFERLLREILKDPERRLSELPLLTAAEERQLLGWNETAAAYQAGVCLHELIEARVDETPARVAVSFEGGALTYAELDAAANRLACRLRDLGVGLEVPVGVFAERSLEMVVSLLAVLKAGGAYLPLDPEYPADRLTFMLADSRVPVVLAQERLLPRLPEHGAQVILLDGVARERGERLAGGARPENLAYVIYTSGSTGRPKGTMNTHRGIVNRLLWMQERYGLTADDRVLQKTPFSFDVSVWELFWPLLAGARLVVARPGGHQDASYLARTIVAETITTLHFVPSMLQVFLEAPGVEECRSLLRVICSGEALPLELERRFFARLDGVELHNLYGPTEAAVDVTYWQCERDGDRGVVPIGHPVANTQIHLLDVAGSPVPVGIPGELHIGGVQVCRGYLARPELTAERFVPDPFSIAPGSRLYRTGDLVRYLPDGAVDFLGRTDHQVKVRGLRIELGEIESAVAGHPGIREALVVARADGDAVGAVNLVAYITLRQKETEGLSLSELRERLARTLPEYMLPSALVVLESMPLTASGKVDRKALPAPGRTAVEREPVAPRTELERSLAGLWSELLGSLEAGSIGVEDNFFQLGGNSITGAIFINRLQKELGASVPAVTIFDAPTIARLAAHLGAEYPEAVARRWDREAAAGDPARSWTAIERRAIEPGRPQPLSFAQERLWFLEQLDPSKSTYNVPNVLRLAGPLDAALLARVLGEVVRRHAALRTTFGTVEGRPAQIVSAHFDLAFEICDLTTLPAEERAVEARRQVARGVDHPFDLARGPLLRTLLLRLGSEEHVAVLTMHHIVSDGWSMGVLVREVAALYSAFSQGLSSPLPELPVQYVDFARWQREWLRGEVLESQTAYWKERLSGVGALELPTDRPRPPEQTFAGAVLPLFFSRELRDELAALGRREEATLFMTGLAAFAVLLARYAGQEDVAVGTPSANRNRPEIEDLIGFFVNTLVVRTSAAGDPPFRELLARVREASVGAFAHQDLPFEKVVEELRPERDLSRSPLFQVMFILQNADNQTLELPGLHLEPQPFPVTAAKFELTLTIVEDPRRSLSGSLEYNTDLFDAATAARLIGHFHRLLRGIVGDPKKRLSELPLLTEAERWELLAGWNDTAVSWPRETLLHELFEQQAAARPEARAVGFGAEHLSYGELEARSNRLARHLRGLGVGPEILVGLCVERSVEMVVALLAILKAGGAYVPLDPSHPAERLGLVLEDSAVPVLVSEEGLLDRLPPHGARVVCLDREAGAIASESAEPLERVTAAESLAYVLYTSG
ncbi:MAG TPA: amino acid adenylation domain-containing protein, partial [Thermoanaerobaculia bacterium]